MTQRSRSFAASGVNAIFTRLVAFAKVLEFLYASVRRRRSAVSGWVRAERVAARPYQAKHFLNTLRWTESWYLSSLLFGAVIAGSTALRQHSPVFLEDWAPSNAGEALGLAWQVQTSIAAIAFAGLALIIQLATNPPVAIRSSREVLYRETLFRGLLLFVGISNVTLGIVGTWLVSDGALILCFVFCFVLPIGFIGFSYFRAARYFLDDRKAAASALSLLEEKLAKGLYLLDLQAGSNARLGELFPTSSPIRFGSRLPHNVLSVDLVVAESLAVIEDVDYLSLKRAGSRILSQLPASELPATEGGVSLVKPAIHSDANQLFLSLNYAIGETVHAGRPIFSLVSGAAISDSRASSFARELRRCVSLKEGGREEDGLRDELVTLKDSLLVAISAGTTGALRRGLDAYEKLFGRVIASLHSSTEPTTHFFYGAYGPYWRWLQRDVREVALAAISSLGERGLSVAVDNAYSLCRMSFEGGDYDALREFLSLYPAYLYAAEGAASIDSPEYIAVSLQNLTDLYMRSRVERNPSAQEVVDRHVADVWAGMLRVYVDRPDPDSLKRLLAYFGHPILFSSNVRRSGARAKAATLLAVFGWTLYRTHKLGASDGLKQIAADLIESVPSRMLWEAYADVVDESARIPPWSNWEISTKVPLQFHFAEFDSYLATGALLMAGRVGAFCVPTEPSTEDSDQAGRLLAGFDLARTLGEILPSCALGDGQTLKDILNEVIVKRRERDRQSLRVSTIDKERVHRFVEAMRSALLEENTRISSVFAGEDSVVSDEDSYVYLSTRIPKEYFVSVHGESADPDSLASSYAHAIIAGENKFIVKAIASQVPWEEGTVDAIGSAVASLRSEDAPELFIVVLNSWTLADALGVADWFPEGSARAGIFLDVDGLGEGCLVLDLARSRNLIRQPRKLDGLTDWVILPDVDVAVAVRDVQEDVADPVVEVAVGVALEWLDPPVGVTAFRVRPTPSADN
ncbi:hypothetical protein [Micromonospora sp. WMMB235]|uniref:hypothetical protein n=1 Tax=Micromonospora sp. WMMB235 TaxID=1172030 RepID=UPI00115FFB91|nr:hypothetical protein [Micromonospora sp. WMMB235]